MSRYRNNFWTSRNSAISALIVLIPFLILAGILLYSQGTLNRIDYNLGESLYALRTPERTKVAIGVTSIGDVWSQTVIGIVVTTLLLTLKEYKAAIWYGVTCFVGAALMNQFFKNLFTRTRPDYIEHLVTESTYAFPSGHAMGMTIILGALAFVIYRLVKTRMFFKYLAILYCLITAILVGLSRVYLGVHYPSDVLAGFSLGGAWVLICISVYGITATK